MAGFNTAVTGLKASSTLLDVAGNNIANSSTVGFKATRTEFADIFATSVVGAGASNQPGSGVTVSDTSQDFSAGTIEFTNNNLDLAINGSGFFQLDDGQGGITYTRAGAFELDKDGFIVSKNGKYLQGYGLDALGNQLPLQNLSVTQKESPPHATENIGLSFNIDSSADAEALSRTFDKNNPGSYTYSTTVETVDSLGNSNSVRFYMVEQAAVREQYEFNLGDLQTYFTTGAGLGNTAATAVSISGVTFSWDQVVAFPTIASTAKADEIAAADPRIDLSTLSFDSSSGYLFFELNAGSTGAGDVVINSEIATVEVQKVPNSPTERAANEVQTIELRSFANVNFSSSSPTITFGDVEIPVTGTNVDTDDLGDLIESYERQIVEKNPDIDSVVYNSTTRTVDITWKPEVGDVDELVVSVDNDTTPSAVFAESGGAFVRTETNGDNSYQGMYRMYAYLNDETAVDIGKVQDPGEGSLTEVGPILIKFDSTTGVLSEVNGEEVAVGGTAPRITLLGADPANPNDELLDTDVDSLVGIQLDITGSSQFASESIVKAASQDGYPKGDLIGVTFAETGEMVASFSNGQRQNLGLVAIASFENQSGLLSAGTSEWIATLNSGAAILNPPGTGLNGTLRSAALEQSNVDLSAELVKLIEGQRNFQANSKTLETMNTVTQAILQI